MNRNKNPSLDIRANSHAEKTGIISFAGQSIPCVLGKGGIVAHKIEGDGATPRGTFNILYGFYRSDRIRSLSTNIIMIATKKDYGWCDDTDSPLYNRFVRLPTKWRHETLWREDNLYDICLVLDHNLHPRKQNCGSAIFFHLKHSDNNPTEGCIAVSLAHMKKLLMRCKTNSTINIHL